jgi:nitric oxide reductase NorE protein
VSMAAGRSINKAEHLPGETGIWVLVSGDLLLFSVSFIVLVRYRVDEAQVFTASQPYFKQFIGALNTLLLLTSSMFVALAVKSARSTDGTSRSASRLIAIAALRH